ncbi:hypothetical protein SAMN05660662_0510 [Blastococcus aurantiacus]|uniref:Uncharacterized protein n=1 Tax=Blastococcus aurantiacus TaxID=1550231 RepID=A0A1G7HC92_9ACTN|nr:hypothetical protein [Blastococcus aurantiacus]SDE97981.1 hypothetical protein SAMN05660662_0510 [Blastococcus aurantiacus]
MPDVPTTETDAARPPLPVRLPVPGADVAEATATLTELSRRLAQQRPRHHGLLELTVRRSGEVRLTRTHQANSRFPIVYPTVTGRLVAEPAAVHLVGEARPSRFHVRTTAGMAVAGVPLLFAGLTALFGLDTDGNVARILLLLLVVGAVAVVRWEARRPRRGFPAEVHGLLQGLTDELAPDRPPAAGPAADGR